MNIRPNNAMIKQIGKYDLVRIIGKGSFAIVYFAINRETKKEFAIKEVLLDQLDPKNPETEKLLQFFEQEVEILKNLDHPNIIKLIDLINTQSKIYMIFEYCALGDLEKYLKKNCNKLPEKEAKPLIIQILNAFRQLNNKKIVHRDIKLANVLITSDFKIKLADFGFAKYKRDQQLFESFCGTPITMAPEILQKFDYYDDKCDIWSLGVIIYQMIFGKPPYFPQRANINDLIDLINRGQLIFPKDTQISDNLKDLLKKMLVNDPAKRISFKELFDHKWVEFKVDYVAESQNLLRSIYKIVTKEVEKEEEIIQHPNPIFQSPTYSIYDDLSLLIMQDIYTRLEKFNKSKNIIKDCENMQKDYERLKQMKLKEILLNFVDKIKKSIDNFEIILKDSGKKQAQYVMLTSKFYQNKFVDCQKELYRLCLDMFQYFNEVPERALKIEILKCLTVLWQICQAKDSLFSNSFRVKVGGDCDLKQLGNSLSKFKRGARKDIPDPSKSKQLAIKCFNIKQKPIEWEIFGKMVDNRCMDFLEKI